MTQSQDSSRISGSRLISRITYIRTLHTHLFIDNTPAMSRLGQVSSTRNVLPVLHNGFGGDADDDDLSLDGIYDDDQDIRVPGAFNKVSDTKGEPVASTGSAFNAQIPGGSVPNRRPLVTPNSTRPHNPLVGAPVTHNEPPRRYYPGVDVCIVCQARPPYSRNGEGYPTCSLTCARVLEYAVNGKKSPPGTTGYIPPPPPPPPPTHAHTLPVYGNAPQINDPAFASVNPIINLLSFLAGLSMGTSYPPHTMFQDDDSTTGTVPASAPSAATDPCVVCRKPLSPSSKYVTCGLTCAEKLTIGGGRDANMCNYCHRRPKVAGQNQCGQTCAQAAKLACLLCKSRPKFKHHDLCGKTCNQLSTKKAPMLLEVPVDHVTWDMIQKKFDDAWKMGTKPTIKNIYKIIGSKTFLLPYDEYKKKIGRNTEVFHYHGTSRRCKLGTNGNTMLCNDSGCSLCCILRTSFKISLASPYGPFGAGIYTSSAANRAYSYSSNGQGALILTSVVLGNVYYVNAFAAVTSCPAGYQSVVFDRRNGILNDTVVYSDDAIRPVFLLVFT